MDGLPDFEYYTDPVYREHERRPNGLHLVFLRQVELVVRMQLVVLPLVAERYGASPDNLSYWFKIDGLIIDEMVVEFLIVNATTEESCVSLAQELLEATLSSGRYEERHLPLGGDVRGSGSARMRMEVLE